jgi:hypothetical protein
VHIPSDPRFVLCNKNAAWIGNTSSSAQTLACRGNKFIKPGSHISQLPTAQPMTANGTDMSWGSRMSDQPSLHKSKEEEYFPGSREPRALREALRLAGSGMISTPSESASEEDYDEESQKPIAVLRLNKGPAKEQAPKSSTTGSKLKVGKVTGEEAAAPTPSDVSSEHGTLDDISSLKGAKVYTIAADDKELREILRRGLQRVSIGTSRFND